ncbi:hypothetical protein Hanom_Chr11g01026181 [Helianthus anomalus]
MFTPFCRRCPLTQKLTSFVLNVPKSCTFYPLGQTQLSFLVKPYYTKVMCKAHEGNLVLLAFYFKFIFYIDHKTTLFPNTFSHSTLCFSFSKSWFFL